MVYKRYQIVYSRTGSFLSNRVALTNAFIISRDAWVQHSWMPHEHVPRVNDCQCHSLPNASPHANQASWLSCRLALRFVASVSMRPVVATTGMDDGGGASQ